MAYIERAITEVKKNRVNFDDRLARLQAREEPRLFFLNHPCPLFIDEVRKENAVLEEIKMIVDESDQRGQFLLSGSQKLELMKGMSESLAGILFLLCVHLSGKRCE